jgi:ribosomal protein S18 acetylase RimI-like enzyme
VKNVTRNTLLTTIERFYDAVPRTGAVTESYGGLTLFVRDGHGWPYYARPALGGPDPTVDDVLRVRERQRELGVPEAFEWVDEVTPGLAPLASDAGLAVVRHPLMVLDQFAPVPVPAGVEVRLLDPASDQLAEDYAAVQAVAMVGFSSPGTALGDAGTAERDNAVKMPSAAELKSERVSLRAGRVARAILADESGPLCVGSYQRAGDVVEVVGVATLPNARRRGLGAAITSALTRYALDQGAELVFLSAGDEDVARVYGRVGFRLTATACIAEPT